jgi:hypothetical protein
MSDSVMGTVLVQIARASKDNLLHIRNGKGRI